MWPFQGCTSVYFNGMVCSLTATTRKIMGLAADAAIQPTSYWNYGDDSACVSYECCAAVRTEKLMSSVNYRLDKNPILRDSESGSSPALDFEYFI